MTFDEDSAYNKSRKRPAEDPEETKAPRIHDTTMNEETQEEDREFVRKDMGLQKRITEKERGPDPAPGM